MEKMIQEYYLQCSDYSQRCFLGKDYKIRGIVEANEGGSMEMYVEVAYGGRKDRESQPPTYFYVFQTNQPIRAGLEFVGSVPMKSGAVFHVYLQPNKRISA